MPHTGTVLLLDFTPDCVKLMTGSMDKFSRLWDLRTSQPFHEWEHNGEESARTTSRDGRWTNEFYHFHPAGCDRAIKPLRGYGSHDGDNDRVAR